MRFLKFYFNVKQHNRKFYQFNVIQLSLKTHWIDMGNEFLL